MGCLKALFVRIGCLVFVIVLLVLGIVFRSEIWDYYTAWRGNPGAVYVAPAEGGAARARDAVERLARRGGPAYEDLTAADLAALVTEAIARSGERRVFDSVRLALLDNEIRVKGVLDLSGVPRNLLGPLAGMVSDHEPAAIGGPLGVDSAGGLELTVTYLKLRDFPFPRSTVPRLLEAARIPGARGARVPLPGVSRIGDVRITPSHVRLYRSTQQ